MALRVAINGFGRIGRMVLRLASKSKAIQVVAINDLTSADTLAHLFKYDSVHGIFPGKVSVAGNVLTVNGQKITIYNCKSPADLPWKKEKIDVVLEATGLFTDRENAQTHLAAGAKRVVISAPATDEDITIVMGVNHELYNPRQHFIISNASCTTNCLAPVAKVLNDAFGIEQGLVTTVHSYTNDQRILDLPHKDLRRARAAAVSMIPTTTGAAKAVAKVIPALKGRLDGMAIRVPTPNVSVVDLVATLKTPVTEQKVNAALKKAARGSLKGILAFEEQPLVSVDFNGTAVSSTIDAGCTKVMGDKMIKVLSWYDNESGFSNRLVDLLTMIATKG